MTTDKALTIAEQYTAGLHEYFGRGEEAALQGTSVRGGSLQFLSNPGRGTELTVTIPSANPPGAFDGL